MKICDKCAAQLVKKEMIKPAGHFFPPMEIPWHKGVCPLCNKEDNLLEHPEIKAIKGSNVTIIKETITLEEDEFNRRFK